MNICRTCGRKTLRGKQLCYRHNPRKFRTRLVDIEHRDTRKFDPEPLKVFIRATGPVATVCRNAGIQSRFIYRDHKLQANTVDRICTALEVHPAFIYGHDWWWRP